MSIDIFFKPKKNYILTRVGRNNDGGYLVSKYSLKKSDYLVSFGINDDWSFEREALKINKNIKVLCFDNKISLIFLCKRVIIEFFKFFYPGKRGDLLRGLKNIIEYIFSKIKFKKKFIQKNDTLFISKNLNNIFFKVDIERNEYEILNDLIKIKKITGIIIEFHDFDRNILKIKNFIKKTKFKITHIHPNNFGGINTFGDPKIIEITLEKNSYFNGMSKRLPHKLDQPNNQYKKDIKIIFK